jgi:outer membrane lipoprotein-sorting protein
VPRVRSRGVFAALALAVPFAVLEGACASAPAPPPAQPRPPLRSASLAEVLDAYDAWCKGLETLSASGDLTVFDWRKRQSRRVGIRLVARRGGELYLKGSVAVITALEVVSDGRRFWFRLPSRKKVWTGPAGASVDETEEVDADAPYRALRPVDVTAALMPEPLDPAPGDSVILDGDTATFSLTLARLEDGEGAARRRVWISRDGLRLVRSRTYDERGDLVREALFSAWEDGVPREVTVSRPGEGYTASFALTKVKTNVPVPDRAFVPRLPEGDTVIEVKD